MVEMAQNGSQDLDQTSRSQTTDLQHYRDMALRLPRGLARDLKRVHFSTQDNLQKRPSLAQPTQ